MKLPLSPDTPWLERGFFLSLGEKTTEDGRSYYRTARGAYVAAGDVSGYEEKDFQGVALGEMTWPFGYTKKETKLIELTPDGKLKRSRRSTSGCSWISRRRSTSRGGPT
jgi:hypothetical protein